MPEPPDFEQIAASILSGPPFRDGSFGQVHIRSIAGQLRQVWNARGAADVAAIDAARAAAEKAGTYCYVDATIKNLDR